MAVKNLKIKGMRSFESEENIEFAIPNGEMEGSGLTIIVGPNNSGKTTIVEAFHLLQKFSATIPSSIKNEKCNGEMLIELEDDSIKSYRISTGPDRGAFVERETRIGGAIIKEQRGEYASSPLELFILSNKRNFSSTFHNIQGNRERKEYGGNVTTDVLRENENQTNHDFGSRLSKAIENKGMFNSELRKILSPLPEWRIESKEGGQFYLELEFDGIKHSSQSAGDGFINLFNIIDALYDAEDKGTIIIDEPEVSLHPDLQRKLYELILEKSKEKQIILCTHSPYFIDWKIISNEANLYRLKKENGKTMIFKIGDDTKQAIKSMISEVNPHTLGLDAKEIFFLNDNVILTEGQEDVVCYRKIFEKYRFKPNASFFGWGVGGAKNIEHGINILMNLGYAKIFVILDNDQRENWEKRKETYPNIGSYVIPTDDVRNKSENNKQNLKKIFKIIDKDMLTESKKEELMKALENEEGLISSFKNMKINEKYDKEINELIEAIKKYFQDENKLSRESSRKATKKDNENIIEKVELAKAEKILENSKLHEHIKSFFANKFTNIEFKNGGSGQLSRKQIGKNTFYYIIEHSEGIGQEYKVTYNFHVKVNTKKEKVDLIKKKCVYKKLP